MQWRMHPSEHQPAYLMDNPKSIFATEPAPKLAAEQAAWFARLCALPLGRIGGIVLLLGLCLLAADTGNIHEPGGGVAQIYAGADVGGRFDIEAISDAAQLPAAAQPVTYVKVSQDRARQINAAVPFSTNPNPAALPFILGGTPASQERAVDCLAAAQYYEAGTDWEGQSAVAQVVLNRARHPAYPGSVCGVVFQGQERRTGCQFSFTCDGAMARTPSVAHWELSRAIARLALAGDVYPKVGLATHYHTDWVVPVWSSQLEKITKVRTHLFFRWPGSWGRPGIFSVAPSLAEPVIPKLARLSFAHREALSEEEELSLAAELAEAEAELALELDGSNEMSTGPAPAITAAPASEPALAGVNMRGSQLRVADTDNAAFAFLLPNELPGSFGLLAYEVCGRRSYCKVMGWTEAGDVPASLPAAPEVERKAAFLYLYDRASRREIMAWDCDIFPRREQRECLTPDMLR